MIDEENSWWGMAAWLKGAGPAVPMDPHFRRRVPGPEIHATASGEACGLGP